MLRFLAGAASCFLLLTGAFLTLYYAATPDHALSGFAA